MKRLLAAVVLAAALPAVPAVASTPCYTAQVGVWIPGDGSAPGTTVTPGCFVFTDVEDFGDHSGWRNPDYATSASCVDAGVVSPRHVGAQACVLEWNTD